MALVDLEMDVKPWLDIPDSDNTSDAILETCMEAASAYCEKFTGRILEEQDITEQVNGNGLHFLRLRNFPISQVWFCAIDENWDFGSGTEVDPSEILIDNENQLVRRIVWPQGVKNVQVTYAAGYAPDDVPADLIEINLNLVEFFYRSRSDFRLGVVNRNKIGETLTFTESVPKTITDMLAPYVWEAAVANLLRRQSV